MEYKKVTQWGSIEVIIPHERLTDGSIYQQGGYALMVRSLNPENQYLIEDSDGNQYNVARINNIEPIFVQAILGDALLGLTGYEINMLNGNSKRAVYAHLEKTRLDEIPEFSKTPNVPEGVTLREFVNINREVEDQCIFNDDNDPSKVYILVEAYTYQGGKEGFTKFDEIIMWAEEFGKESIIITTRKIKEPIDNPLN